MGTFIDRTGESYNNWTIIEYKGDSRWLKRCKCGTESIGIISNVINGTSRQCPRCQWDSISIDQYEHELPEAIWNKMRLQAKRREIPFEISKDYAYSIFLKQNRRCKLSGIELKIALNPKEYRGLMQTASLDRIDSSKNYEEGNVQWIHKDINLMKNTLSDERLIELCKLIAKHNE